jgi:hypothetical protein
MAGNAQELIIASFTKLAVGLRLSQITTNAEQTDRKRLRESLNITVLVRITYRPVETKSAGMVKAVDSSVDKIMHRNLVAQRSSTTNGEVRKLMKFITLIMKRNCSLYTDSLINPLNHEK